LENKDSEIKNLEAISKAIDHHNSTCEFPAVKILMNPFEVKRLDWDEIRGLPIEPDPNIGTGRFHIVCANETTEKEEEVTEAIGVDTSNPKDRELITV
jgi:hypothetical protein